MARLAALFGLAGLVALAWANPTPAEADFSVPVAQLAPPPHPHKHAHARNFSAYLFAYFIGEALPGGEAISFAVSTGNTPDKWTKLHGGKPILRSSVGTKGVRDPSIIRSVDGKKFFLIATDLRIEGLGPNPWQRAIYNGSKNLVVWESTDLKHWGKERLVRVSDDNAGMTWAPEAVWDERRKQYMVYWASMIRDGVDNKPGTPVHNRIMRAWTPDFKKFSKPETWIYNPQKSIIDTCMVRDPATKKYYRFTKDESVQYIYQENGNSLDVGGWEQVRSELGKPTMKYAEGPLVFASITVPGKFHLFLDEFASRGRGYTPFETTNIAAADWKLSSGYVLPTPNHHGTVIPITAAEQKRLLGK